MSPLSESRALELLKNYFGNSSRPYFWETVQDIEWSGIRPITDFLPAENYDVVFDPNDWTMPSRIEAARYFKRDDALLGYQLSLAELTNISRQSWASDTDFYIFKRDGSLCALRTHEDSEYGFWVPTSNAQQIALKDSI